MKITDEHIREFDEYLRGNMSADERSRFEHMIGSDTELLAGFDQHQRSIINMDNKLVAEKKKLSSNNHKITKSQVASPSGQSNNYLVYVFGVILLLGIAIVVYFIYK